MIGAASVVAVGRNHVLEREILYTTTGTHSWTCPAGVNYVSVVCIGGGGGGMSYGSPASSYTYAMNGGGGGGLAWMNNISVPLELVILYVLEQEVLMDNIKQVLQQVLGLIFGVLIYAEDQAVVQVDTTLIHQVVRML